MSEALPYVRGYRKNVRAIRTQSGDGRIGDFAKSKYQQAKALITSDAAKALAKKLIMQGLSKGASLGLEYANKKLGSGYRKKKAQKSKRRS